MVVLFGTDDQYVSSLDTLLSHSFASFIVPDPPGGRPVDPAFPHGKAASVRIKNLFFAPGPGLFRLLLLGALLAGAGCEWHGGEYLTEPAPRRLVVHGMLAVGAQEQEIILEYTRHLDEGYYRGLTPASGARVTVEGEEAHPFHEDPERPGMYRASFTPRPGARYALHVQGPGGEVLTGETLAPGPSFITLPTADTVVARGGEVAFGWTRAPGAAGYVIADRAPGRPESVGRLLHPRVVGDTALTMQFGLLGGSAFHVRVVAVDASYVRYTRGAPDSPDDRSRIRSTVQGGYGLFGSYAPGNSRRITLR